jgi:hypothetical protein
MLTSLAQNLVNAIYGKCNYCAMFICAGPNFVCRDFSWLHAVADAFRVRGADCSVESRNQASGRRELPEGEYARGN